MTLKWIGGCFTALKPDCNSLWTIGQSKHHLNTGMFPLPMQFWTIFYRDLFTLLGTLRTVTTPTVLDLLPILWLHRQVLLQWQIISSPCCPRGERCHLTVWKWLQRLAWDYLLKILNGLWVWTNQEGNNPWPLVTGEYVSRLARGVMAEGACLLYRKVLSPQIAWGERILHKLILTVVSDIFISH